MISFSLCESWWFDGKMIWRQSGWSPFLCVRANGLTERWFEDRLPDLFVFVWEVMAGWKVEDRLSDRYVFMWELMAGWKVDLKTSWMIAFFMCELMAWLKVYLETGCLISLSSVRADGLMESWFEDRLSDLLFFVWELIPGWKVDLETGCLISLSSVRANGLMESWFGDRLADLFVFVWELMAWWKVDLKTGCLISFFFVWELIPGWKVDLKIGWLIYLSLWESWWLYGKLIWRKTGWSPFLCVRANGLTESWFGDRLSDLFVFVWEIMTGCESWFEFSLSDLSDFIVFIWKVMAVWSGVQFRSTLRESNLMATTVITIGFNEGSWFSDVDVTRIITGIDSLILVEFAALYGKLIWRQALWLHCLLYESWWLYDKLIWRQTGWSPWLCERADGWMESWFEDRLADLLVFVWELIAWWKVVLKTD